MRHHQTGSLLMLLMLGLVAAGILATVAYGSYFQIARGTVDTVARANASALLTQAAYTLATEARDSDTDGISEPPAGLVVTGGFVIPASSGAPKADAWGSAFKYCPWNNGSNFTADIGHLAGVNPALQSSLQFAVISAGTDKTFDTSCDDAKTTGAKNDDGVRVMSVAQVNQGVGGTYYYGDPVATVLALPATGAPTGMLRVALDSQIPYLWNGSSWLPLTAGAWLVITPTVPIPNPPCSAFLPGTFARDASDNLYICDSNLSIPDRKWKKI